MDAAARLLPGRFSLLTLPSSEMPALYRSADVFLHLSKEESFGNVFVEALACGLPVVAPDTPRVRWIVGNEQYLITSSDPQAIAAAIDLARLAPAQQKNSRIAVAAQFSWDRVGRLYQEFLQQIATA